MSINCIRTLIESANNTQPQKTAIVYENTKLTYEELFVKVNQVAFYLKELNLPTGSRIGLYSNKQIDQVVAILAILSTDYILVPLTTLLKSEQVEYIIEDCDIKCIITDKVKIKSIEKIDFKGHLISFETTDKETASFEEIYKYYNKPFEANVTGHQNAVITYSFGLSGRPKGIVISHRNLIDSARVVSQYLDLKKDDVISGVLIFNLDYGLNQIFCSLYKKATLALHRFLLPVDFFNHLINDKVSILPIMPINLTQIFDEDFNKLPSAHILSNVRIITSSGGNVTSKMVNDVEKLFTNAKFYSMHGLTEAFRSTYLEPEQLKIRPTSIGKAIPDVELYVINENGEECKPREVGELIHRGSYIYRGFWNGEEETKTRFKSIKILEKVLSLEGNLVDEIVIASGDYVYKDEEGYIFFVSRNDDMIKSRGFRINPIEIETVVNNNIKEINKCVVFSIENEEIEEEIVLVYTSANEVSKNEILFELKKHLASYMLPARIIYRKNLPLNPHDTSKVNKEELKREIQEGK